MAVSQDSSKTGRAQSLGHYSGVVDFVGVGDSMTVASNARVLITSATRSSNVVTVVATSHNLATGMLVTIANCTPSDFNVQNVAVTVSDANTFTYQSTGSDGSAASLGGTKPMVMINMSRQQDLGYLFWLQSKSVGAFRQVANAGANGQTAADMLSRFGKDVLAHPSAQLVIILTGYNDFAGNARTADAVYSDVTTMATMARNSGKRVCIVSALPWTTGGTNTDRGEAARYNRKIRAFCGVTEGVRFADAAKYLVDATNATRFSPLSGMLGSDGIHPTPKGAERIAQAIWDAVQRDTPVVSRLVSSNADNYGFDSSSTNIQDNGPWTNSGGTVTAPASGTAATGFTVTMSATGTCVASCPAQADAIGYAQRMVITSSADQDFGTATSSSIASSRYSAGDKVQLISEVKLTNVSGSNLQGINCYITYAGVNIRAYASLSTATAASEYPQSDVTLTMVSPEFTIPTGATGITITHQAVFKAAGTACTVDVSRVSLEKVS
jgi:lysophospholipase L1-like esterase